VSGKRELIVNPAFATSIGLMAWAARERGLRPSGVAPVYAQASHQRSDTVNSWMRKLQVAVRAMLP
jgi:hypothetical protein